MAELAGDAAEALRESFAQARGKVRVLMIEDEALLARAVKKRLEKAGHECALAATLAHGRDLLRNNPPALILLDLRLPDGAGLDFLAELRSDSKAPPAIVLTAYGDISDAVQAMKLGATDYLKKPVDLDELLLTVEKAARTAELHYRLDYSRERDSHAVEGALLLGESSSIRNLREQITHLARIAPVESQSNAAQPTVLITGETGAGKDVAARLLHLSSASRAQPFVHVDCASLPRELIEAELFGHEKGAFTGSHGARPGLIEAAENGALFLDEVGELPVELQAKLLNVLERRKSRRLGSVREYTIGARIIAATNRDLPQMIAQGSFRADLYYRLNVVTLSVPPLRVRGDDDIGLLARHFAEQTGRRYGLPPVVLAAGALPALCAYHWPGNVRELKHVIDRAALLGGGRPISASDLALAPRPPPVLAHNASAADSVLLRGLTLDGAERLLIESALRDCNDNVSEAARRLGVSRMTLRYRMEKYQLKGS